MTNSENPHVSQNCHTRKSPPWHPRLRSLPAAIAQRAVDTSNSTNTAVFLSREITMNDADDRPARGACHSAVNSCEFIGKMRFRPISAGFLAPPTAGNFQESCHGRFL